MDVAWYYRLLSNYSHVLETANQRPLEIDRARWCTAANIRDWYTMLATALVDAGVAIVNPDYDASADPESRAGQPIIITHPDRIFSFDESRVEMDMTKASKAKQERTLVDKTVPRQERNETLAAKGGQNGTGVGGSTADGKALPGLFIFAGAGLSPAMCKPTPNCDFYDADGKMLAAKFTANKKGGVIGDVGVQYLRDVVLPCFPGTCEEQPLVGICDGHGSHLTLALLDFCRDNHVRIVLRVPHSSHLTQGEDVRNFLIFKSELRRQKSKQLTLNVQERGLYTLKPEDFMKVVTPAWNKAFDRSNNIVAWRDTGLFPFTRKVYFTLLRQVSTAPPRTTPRPTPSCTPHSHT